MVSKFLHPDFSKLLTRSFFFDIMDFSYDRVWGKTHVKYWRIYMKKRVISAVMTIALVMSIFAACTPAALASSALVQSGSAGTNIRWEFYGDGRLEIKLVTASTSQQNMTNWTSASGVPWYIYRNDIKKVEIARYINIGPHAFNGYPNLETVDAPWVETIGNYAFNNCAKLSSVEAHEITTIGNYAFYGCAALTDIAYYGSSDGLNIYKVTSIGDYAFAGCVSVENVSTYNSGITPAGRYSSIRNYAFSGCINLLSAYVNNATTIGNRAFNGCAHLSNITFPKRMSSFGTGVFAGCFSLNLPTSVILSGGHPNSGNIYFGITDGILYYGNASGAQPWNATIVKAITPITETSFEIPTYIDIMVGTTLSGFMVAAIDAEAFAGQYIIENVTISNFVSNIGLDAFRYCGALEKVTFRGNAPATTGGTRIFDNGVKVYFRPGTIGWPSTSPSTWRGYTAIELTDYVVLDSHSIKVELGKSETLYATVLPAGTSQIGTWVSGNPDIAIVSNNGVVIGIELGMTVITFTTADGRSDTCTVEVVEQIIPVAGVLLDKEQITLTLGSGQNEELTATVYPMSAADKSLTWSISNSAVAYLADAPTPEEFARSVIAVSPGTATITVRTLVGNYQATCKVTVLPAQGFVPVTGITLNTTSLAMGASIDLNAAATVQPSNATRKSITWEVISGPASVNAQGILTAEWNQTGTIVVEATIDKGKADSDPKWDYLVDLPYKQRFNINTTSYTPVSSITDVPTSTFVGVPLQLKGTVYPAGATYKTILWEVEEAGSTGAYIDPTSGMLVAQNAGNVVVRATIQNGVMAGFSLDDFSRLFTIRINQYNPYTLTIRADPGGSVGGVGNGQIGDGETITITATPNSGYIFAGWHSSNGGTFADANSATTQFTMPGNTTTITAFFTFVGASTGSSNTVSGGGSAAQPTANQYFTHGSIYTRNSGVNFAHVTVRSFTLFSHVVLDGKTLVRNSHYKTGQPGENTEVTLVNGYLDTLNPGQHTLEVHFKDKVSVSAVFTVVVTAQTTQTTQTPQTYDDVHTSNWYYADVVYVSQRGWMTSKPTEPNKFRPSDPVTQGEVIDALYQMAGSPAITNQYGYTLQGRDASYEWVISRNILPIGGKYNLNSAITRQDIAVILARLTAVLNLRYTYTRSAPNFTDTWQIDSVARAAVINLFRAGVISGRTEKTFVPLGSMTRAECAAILHRFDTATT